MNYDVHHDKNLTALLNEMKEELKEFVQTRIAMLKLEVQEKTKTLKTAAPLLVGGALFLATAYFLLTLALVALVFAFLPDTPYRWFLAFLAITVLWSIIGGVAIYFAKRELEWKGLMPKRTIETLKGDKTWVQAEVRNQV